MDHGRSRTVRVASACVHEQRDALWIMVDLEPCGWLVHVCVHEQRAQ